jgi:hypothetical protein
MATLLEKAKAVKTKARNTDFPKEEIELAVAWANNKVSTTQVAHALGQKSTSGGVYVFLATRLRAYIQTGLKI